MLRYRTHLLILFVDLDDVQVTGSSHKAKLSHELIAGAVAYGVTIAPRRFTSLMTASSRLENYTRDMFKPTESPTAMPKQRSSCQLPLSTASATRSLPYFSCGFVAVATTHVLETKGVSIWDATF